jgi:two-component system cell cycle sensor histidine kinase/response regulator CckA
LCGLDLTLQLLSYVRRQAPTPSLTDVNAAVGAVTRMVRRLMPARIELITRCDPTVAGAGINRGKCEQVLLNLVLNARDAIAADGRIVIETSNVADVDGRCIKLSVTDTGSGMDDATQARLFEPFFTTKGDAGTGLGLAVVQSIVSEAGGQVAVSSTLGRGTTFTVLLPSSDEPLCSHPATEGDVSMLRGSETILLVEDNGDLRDAYARVLRNHGYTVYEARDGSEALQVQREHQLELDLLITDLDLPRLGGRELANALRSVQPSLRTLFTSGHRAADMPDFDGAAADFLEKPFTGERLVRGVSNLLQRCGEPISPVRTPTVHPTH